MGNSGNASGKHDIDSKNCNKKSKFQIIKELFQTKNKSNTCHKFKTMSSNLTKFLFQFLSQKEIQNLTKIMNKKILKCAAENKVPIHTANSIPANIIRKKYEFGYSKIKTLEELYLETVNLIKEQAKYYDIEDEVIDKTIAETHNDYETIYINSGFIDKKQLDNFNNFITFLNVSIKHDLYIDDKMEIYKKRYIEMRNLVYCIEGKVFFKLKLFSTCKLCKGNVSNEAYDYLQCPKCKSRHYVIMEGFGCVTGKSARHESCNHCNHTLTEYFS